jgi:protein-S-isoprenylcysteine O-methyltransferase Ste14
MTHARTNVIVRTAVWLAALAWFVYLRKPPGSGVLQVRTGMGSLAGGALALIGLVLFLWAAWTLASAVPNAVDAPAHLLMRGPFRHVRNPLYVAGALIFAGVSTMYAPWSLRDLLAAGVVAVLVHLFVVFREEPATRRRLGPAYDDYRARVPRWIPIRSGTSRRVGA